MLKPHRRALARVSPDLRRSVLLYFQLPLLRDPIDSILESMGYGQADLVLALLRVNTSEARRLAERVIGRKITVCPPCLRFSRRPAPRASLSVNHHDHVVTWVGENEFQGARRSRFARLRPGMTFSQYITRGGNRRDLRVAASRGLIKIRSAA
jgi:hypothetical protein